MGFRYERGYWKAVTGNWLSGEKQADRDAARK